MNDTLTDYIATHKKTHLIFDFDATLVLMNIPWKRWGENMRQEVLDLDADLWKLYQDEQSPTHMQNALVEKHGERGREILLRNCPPFELQYSDKFDRNDELLKQVEAFREKYHMFIWSSNSSQLVNAVLEDMGMNDWFDKVIARNELRFLKPSPEGFELIYDPKIPKERYLMIGDSSHDKAAAQAASIDFYFLDFFNKGR